MLISAPFFSPRFSRLHGCQMLQNVLGRHGDLRGYILTREEEAATITRCSNEHSHFTSLWDYMRLLQIATSTTVIPFALLETFSFLREFSFIIAESRNAARHFRRRNELLFGKHWNWRKMHFNSLRSKASFSFNNCVSFQANKPR